MKWEQEGGEKILSCASKTQSTDEEKCSVKYATVKDPESSGFIYVQSKSHSESTVTVPPADVKLSACMSALNIIY